MKRYKTLTAMLSPTNLALGLSILVTCLWVFWGVMEMFHEGWYAPFEWAYFLVPAAAMLCLSLISLRWPRCGAILFVITGVGFGALVLWRFGSGNGLSAGWTIGALLSWSPVTVFLVITGFMFYLGRRQSRTCIHYFLAGGLPSLLGLLLAIEPAYRVSCRVDDGFTGERFIQGNDVNLFWAPAGPGWDHDGGTSWNEIALYGKDMAGFEGKRFGLDGLCNGNDDWMEHCAAPQDIQDYDICLYLDRQGTRLMPEIQRIWRMPTSEEVVRSLVTHGENAGCVLDLSMTVQTCATRPDKETPLWDPKSPLIYLWTADPASSGEAYTVTYNGSVEKRWKFSTLGSLGFRCVREVED